jgi:hypothetical protein
MGKETVSLRRWKKAASLHCALVLRPDLDTKGLRELAQKILALGNEEAGIPRITHTEVNEIVFRNMQCIYHKCPMLLFSKQIADCLNEFFGATDENPDRRGRPPAKQLAGEQLE